MADLVVVGGSAGSLDSLRRMLPALSPRFGAAMVIVLHQHPHRRGALPPLLARWSRLRTVAVEDQAPIRPGHVHVCPPNYHTLVEKSGTFALSTDPRVSHARPSIDVLFESAANRGGDGLIGVLLSGGGVDGVAGLGAVQRAGGLSVCQDAESAVEPHLLRSARSAGVVDWIGSPEEIGSKLEELCT